MQRLIHDREKYTYPVSGNETAERAIVEERLLMNHNPASRRKAFRKVDVNSELDEEMVRAAKYHCVYAVRGIADGEHLPHIDTNRR
jgi:hypothetical protein